jgi:predicted Abi (CAAX) family protease
MKPSQNSFNVLNITLWIAQLILAMFFLSGAIMKFLPIEKVSSMMPWTGEVDPILVRLLGIIDLLAATGLILPSLLRIKPQLTPWTSIGIVVLMFCAICFHLLRGEANVISFNIVLMILALFVAWGRWKKVPIENN